MKQLLKQSAKLCPDERCKRGYWPVLLLLLLGGSTTVYAQTKQKMHIDAANLEVIEIDGELCKKLSGHVVLRFEQFTIEAAYALHYATQKLIEAQGDIKITHKDGATITADQLSYEEESQLAQLRGHVVYKSGTATFYTDCFDYDMGKKQGYFSQGGKLVEGGNVLTSEVGQYNDLDKEAIFHKKVTLVNQDYVLQCDTLRYNTVTKIARYVGPTKITSKDGKRTLTTNTGGEYNTRKQQSTFLQSKIETANYTLYGDLLRADQSEAVYMAIGNVKLIAKQDNVIISGDYGNYKKDQDKAEIYGNTLMTKPLEESTLYLSADTFVAQGLGDSTTTVEASHNVKIYKEDLQGKADTMVYKSTESMIYFHGDPIFWNNDIQLTADTIHILLQDKALHTMYMDTNAFIVSEHTKGNYNQLQGSNVIAHFQDNTIHAIDIDGNAESIYFFTDEQGTLQGMNHLRCAQLRIDMKEGEIAKLIFQREPVGVFYPPQKIIEENKKLKHFCWRPAERPTKQEVVQHGYGTQRQYESFKFKGLP